MSSLVFLVLICLLLNVVAPRMSDLMSQPVFSLLDLVDNAAVVGAAPTTEPAVLAPDKINSAPQLHSRLT
jgi:hypothetical protein